MAASAPKPIEKHIQHKSALFVPPAPITDYCQLISTASAFGLVFTGSSAPELKVFLTRSLFEDPPLPVRTISLPSAVTQVAVNCDGTLLAVELASHGTHFVTIYSVPSFLSNQVQVVETIQVSPEANVKCRQVCWNPVIPGSLGLCLSNGGVSLYNLKESGFGFHSLDKSNAVQSICWSPKGKQIVAGQLGFKLVQYKPDLTMARTIQCAPDPAWGHCSVITVQWLSTYQFAVAVLAQGEEVVPNLIIVNAPKSNQISMVDYEDICWSNPGPRFAQIFLVHLQSWNMLLVASANSCEVGVLATTEAGDAPTWIQYDVESKPIMPSGVKYEDSFPLGMALDTGCTHRLKNSENIELPVMPMVHLLANNGYLVCYNIMNQLPNMPDLCSPPRPLQDQSGLCQFIATTASSPPQAPMPAPIEKPANPQLHEVPAPKDEEITFNFGASSTPIVQQKSTNIFGGTAATTGVIFGAGVPSMVQSAQKIQPPQPVQPASTLIHPKPVQLPPRPTTKQPPAPAAPLISVPSKFSSPSVERSSDKCKSPVEKNEDNEALGIIMMEDIQVVESEIKELVSRCRGIKLEIGGKEEMKKIVKDLSGLTDFSQQAVETSEQLWTEVRTLNLSLSEAFSTTGTASELIAMYKNPAGTRPRDYMAQNPATRRTLVRLQNALANNEQQLAFIQKQLISQWAEHEQVKKQYSKDRMHIPRLEGVYETLSRQKEILFREREKINYITTKLGVRMTSRGADEQQLDQTVESIADSILSMTLCDSLTSDTRKINPTKLNQLTAYLAKRPVTVISPRRPESHGLNSEVILERKEKIIKERQQKGVKSIKVPADTVKMKIPLVAVQKPAPVESVQAKTTVKPPTAQVPSLISTPSAHSRTPAPPKPLSFGGFGDSGSNNKLFGSATVASKTETKPIATNLAKENVAPNTMTSKVPEKTTTTAAGFAGVAGLPGAPMKQDNQPTPLFGFNIPLSTSIQAVSSAISEPTKATTATISTVGSGPTNVTLPVSVTAIPLAITSKPIFGGVSSGPISFGSSIEQKPSTNLFKPAESMVNTTPEASRSDEKGVLDNLKVCSPTSSTGSADAHKNIFSSTAFGSLLGISPTTSSNAAAPTTDAPSTAPLALTVEKPATTSAPSGFPGFGSLAVSIGPSSTITASTVAATTHSSGGSLFGSAFGGGTTTGTTTIFGSPSATGNTAAAVGEGSTPIFGRLPAAITTATTSLPKPDQSVFGQAASSTAALPTTLPSAAASTFSFGDMGLGGSGSTIGATAPPFGAPQSQSPFGGGGGATAIGASPGFGVTGGSLFGGTGSAFGATQSAVATNGTTKPTGGSIFGGSSPSNEQGSIFGATASPFGAQPSPVGSGNVFGSPTQSGGSIFGGGGGGAFGSATTNPATSIFGGGGSTAAPASSGFGFGGASPAFGSPAPSSPFGGVQQSQGFGQASSFGAGSAAFGSPPAFGQPATFGGPPVFGGGASFGGGFGTVTASPPAAQNNIFATLGAAAESSLSFGNLAQTSAMPQQKPQFGGSAFSSWR